MTRQEMMKQLVEIKEELKGNCNGELTDHARKWAYLFVDQAIEFLAENEEYTKN